jgi:NAD(P)-dependent dehydrogenase (short-subunit alcohol dehydrogenase family)
MLLKGRTALVTGAAQGIGLSCAQAMVADGARVILADIQQDAVTQAAQGISSTAWGAYVDMGDKGSILDLFAQIENKYGPIDILVNNAGVALPNDFLSYSCEDFDRVIDVNLKGTFIATQRAAQSMKDHGIAGAIINMSSINANLAIANIPAYCASKGGINQLTKAAALSLAPYGIRVNAVGPGSIDTAMLAGVNADDEKMKMVLSRTPLGRLGNGEDVANAVVFLASDKASYITGETIYIDGGRLGLNYVC